MALYSRTNRFTGGMTYDYNDRVVFFVGDQCVVYEFSSGYLGNVTPDCENQYNDEVFKLLGLNQYDTYKMVNGVDANDWRNYGSDTSRNWPECDAYGNVIPEPLAKLVNYLFDYIESATNGGNAELQPLGPLEQSLW